jgi:hypothetical protein
MTNSWLTDHDRSGDINQRGETHARESHGRGAQAIATVERKLSFNLRVD